MFIILRHSYVKTGLERADRRAVWRHMRGLLPGGAGSLELEQRDVDPLTRAGLDDPGTVFESKALVEGCGTDDVALRTCDL